MSQGHHRHRWQVIAVISAVAAATGCAATASIQWTQPLVATAVPPRGPVFVMEPIWRGNATGNIGRDFRITNSEVVTRVLTIVRERFPGAEVADPGPQGEMVGVPRGYSTVTGEQAVTREEFNAATRAYQHGATHLLVPTIIEWKEMRTDDPIGAFVLPHNSITMTLRLMRLQPPALVGQVTFKNRARLTLNQSAARLLNDRFRQVVLRLVSGGA